MFTKHCLLKSEVNALIKHAYGTTSKVPGKQPATAQGNLRVKHNTEDKRGTAK
ncbi:Hypothetical protein LUCI_1734 [Lucifera butyrica]|uniref:Uncharacterized protein n=1 Tax=Lucifera butyrica TaxID=1351585 RepID=A0A498R4X6_9FIRM|nr:Hypothetical protein LUCI_1734 [Lucifera butyrica]